MSTGLGREEIRALLDDLSAELAARGARAELFLVGGAALAVAYDATRATRDLDAVFVPTGIVRQAAAAVAEHRGLTEDWLNDAVKGFLPGPDQAEGWRLEQPEPGVLVWRTPSGRSYATGPTTYPI